MTMKITNDDDDDEDDFNQNLKNTCLCRML